MRRYTWCLGRRPRDILGMSFGLKYGILSRSLLEGLEACSWFEKEHGTKNLCLMRFIAQVQNLEGSGRMGARLPPGERRTVWTERNKNELEESSSPSFYDMTVEEYARKPMTQLSLEHLVDAARDAQTNPSKVLESAGFMCRELPIRLARRLLDLQLLPFIVVTNPHIKQVYESYWHAFNTLRNYPIPVDIASNKQFSSLLRRLVDEHAPMLDLLATGLREVRRKPLIGAHLYLDGFLEAMLRSRISRRILAEQHINLTSPRPGYYGIVNLNVHIAECIDFARSRCRQVCMEHYGVAPEVVVSGNAELKIPYIDAHLDYMLYELIKNSMRAVVEKHSKMLENNGEISGFASHPRQFKDISRASSLPPIHVRICEGSTENIALRISDQGGGIPLSDVDKIWEFGWTDMEEPSNDSSNSKIVLNEDKLTPKPLEGLGMDNIAGLGALSGPSGSLKNFGQYRMAGLGFGLPLSRLYARYFGGDLSLVNIPGYGVDVFLKLKALNSDEKIGWKEQHLEKTGTGTHQ